eukprot:CAMPEP_0113504118 /NCGR_PEP_ID=MMETSP0014_2-20120614/34545_1 /TAXON_ID=2857 /ORGANISM="Nitzschia sp." /LENGTH=1142 /DNA_ID=CAMNT_0000399207 /DNA_START=52 /DNA_END=3480 /DNA_ORIENTATION=+ /assembly_acc=CAM_ASM_000159
MSSLSTTTAAACRRIRRRRRRRLGLTAKLPSTSPPAAIVFVVMIFLLSLIFVDNNIRRNVGGGGGGGGDEYTDKMMRMTTMTAVAVTAASDSTIHQRSGSTSYSSRPKIKKHPTATTRMMITESTRNMYQQQQNQNQLCKNDDDDDDDDDDRRYPDMLKQLYTTATATSDILRGGASGGSKDKDGKKKRKKNKDKDKNDDDEQSTLSNEKDNDAVHDDDDDDMTSDLNLETKDKSTSKHKHRFSSFALTSPFQMYDTVRKEASDVISNIMAQAEELAKQYEEESEEELEQTTSSNDSSSDSNDSRDDHSKDKKKRNKNRNKKNKNKKRRGIQTTETLVGGSGDSSSSTATLVRGNVDDDDGEEDTEKTETIVVNGSVDSDGDEDDDVVDVRGDQEEDPSSSESQPESSNGSKLWWANIWSDLMDESSSSSEEQEDEEGEEDLREEEDESDSTTENQQEPPQVSDGRVEKKTKDDIAEETDLLSDTRDDTGNVTVSSSSSDSELPEDLERNTTEDGIVDGEVSPSFVSSGAWVPIDNLLSLGLASRYSAFRVSRPLRGVRKMSARVTGLHGVLSGKPVPQLVEVQTTVTKIEMNEAEETDRQKVIRKRIAAIERAREGVRRARAIDDEQSRGRRRNGLFGGLFRRNDNEVDSSEQTTDDEVSAQTTDGLQEKEVPQKTPEEIQEEKRRMDRVREIDRLIQEGQASLQTLICEKDVLQRRPNPLFEYTTTETVTTEMTSNKMDVNITEESTIEDAADAAAMSTRTTLEVEASRKMTFPPDDLVEEYIDMMLSTRRLINMNHTHLWQEETEDDEEETIGDDLFTPSANARSLYQDSTNGRWNEKGNGNGSSSSGGGGGSWLLRQSIGSGPTLGEKIGEAAETAAYKAVCKALMSFLARLLSSLHGINVLKHSDIRLVLEQAPDLPPLRNDDIFSTSGTNYAEETIKNVMRRKSRKSVAGSRQRYSSDDSFVQRDAVTEMLLSHVQISAPLLKLFPLAWQRALLGNIITLSTAVISDFLDGLSFQILGHQLSFAFRPITQEDLVRQFRLAGGSFNHRRYKPAEFEAAVRATAEDLSEELKFLDKWHERALGSGVLRTQIANLIARIVLTLTDEILSGARMDLWSSQANGPRILAGLEYRIEEDEIV